MGPPDTGDGTGTFCVQSSGEWRQGSCTGSGVEASVWANSSVLMVNNVTHVVGGYFVLGGKNWTVVSAGQQPRLNLSNNTICGEMSINCGMEGCEQVGYMMASPGSHTTFYHGRLDSLVSENQYNGRLSGNQTRSLYFYHNTSYLWVSTNASNMTQLGGPYNVSGTFNDSYGGQWKVNSISKNKINIVGLNVLAGSGAYTNVSKSKSGVIKIGWLEEFRLGGWDKQTGNQRGLDLDNDSLTNGTVYIAISDSQTAGIYDTFFFFNATGNNAFSTALSVSDPNVNNRKFGLNNSNRVTLLSIDPRADRVRFYSDKMGDWADLGDFRMDGNVSVPIIVRSPNGSSASANASINNIRVKGSSVNRIFSLPGSVPNATITGAGEVRIVNIGQYSLGSGEYVFEVRATVGQNSEMLEEWKWPRASPRTFLVDGYTGQAAYVSGFRQFPITRYDGETYEGEIKELYTANWTQAGKYYKAVLAFI
ncbi:MAG: hypothetical protein NTY20_00680 [Candidatus Aenigmarchaeota archaeon]|nr:hypothetical protein [Candidatus Aenigmarchaeota archaeon]